MNEFNQQYYLEQLTDYHRLFYAIFELGTPIYTEQIKTAAVGLNLGTGKINFMINPKFFFGLASKEQLFILCHEAMHVLLSHIDRSLRYDLDNYISNIAQDIVINETLVGEFGFNKTSLNFGVTLCFIDTVFTEEQIKKHHIVPGKSFEFYYDLLIQYKNEISKNTVLLDFHLDGNSLNGDMVLKDGDGNIIVEIPSEIADSIADKIGYNLSQEELEDLINALKDSYQQHGTGSGGNPLAIKLEEKKKRPWERLIKNKIASLQKTIEKNNETFKFRPRRIVNLPEELHLPEIREEKFQKNDKFNIVFFIDSSGSCLKYQSKFFNLVRSIPEKKFNVKVYSFDSKTYLLDMKKLETKGGGGTFFHILEEKVQDLKINDKDYKKKYPDLVFILSDGDGNDVYPEKPDRWYFLLTRNNTQHIPKKANIILVKDFEREDVKITVKNFEMI